MVDCFLLNSAKEYVLPTSFIKGCLICTRIGEVSISRSTVLYRQRVNQSQNHRVRKYLQNLRNFLPYFPVKDIMIIRVMNNPS